MKKLKGSVAVEVASNLVGGINFSLEDGVIEFFGVKGVRFCDKKWGISDFNDDVMFSVRASSILPEIQGCIDMDVDCGDSGKIAQVQLGARQAVILFLEGKISQKNLLDAYEGKGYIDLPGVELCERVLTVRVLESTEYAVATADKNGEIL